MDGSRVTKKKGKMTRMRGQKKERRKNDLMKEIRKEEGREGKWERWKKGGKGGWKEIIKRRKGQKERGKYWEKESCRRGTLNATDVVLIRFPPASVATSTSSISSYIHPTTSFPSPSSLSMTPFAFPSCPTDCSCGQSFDTHRIPISTVIAVRREAG